MLKLYQKCHEALLETVPALKIAKVHALYQLCCTLESLTFDDYPVDTKVIGGVPERLELVHPQKVPRRRLNGKDGIGAMIHAICHIEYNAINIALDAVYRFRGMPDAYYRDWLRVAAEEAYHYSLLEQHLQQLGYQYGDFPAHGGLWEMTERTAQDVLERMALVPRLLEARGLDVTPDIAKRLLSVKERTACEILSIIFHDEITHVRVGNDWYRYLCQQRKLCPMNTFRVLLEKHAPDYLRGPLRIPARLQAGFNDSEIALMNKLIESRQTVPYGA
jgi:uncharacterized ferritin-like protein (DUF455 family)